MKTLTKTLCVLVVIIATAFLFKGCQKDPITLYPNEYNVYTNGKGGIGSAGGIVMIEDENSPLHGVSVEIPEGALDSMVEIKIELAPDSIKLPGDEKAVVISFLPSGLKFQKPVGIHLPIAEQLDTANLFGWHINYEEMVIKQIYPEIENNKAVLLTDHFSHYTVTDNGIRINKKMYYYDVNVQSYTKRVTAVFWIEGKIDGTNNWGLAGIPLVNAGHTSEYENAHDAVNYYQSNRPRATFKASLKRPYALWPFGGTTVGEEYTIQVETRPITHPADHDIRVAIIDFPYGPANDKNLILKTDQEREDFFGGRQICFHWYEELSSNTNYFIDVFFVIEGLNPNIPGNYRQFTYKYELSTRKERIKPVAMISTNPDTNNDFIVDDTAEPPGVPTVTTANVTNITQTSANGGGNVTHAGSTPVDAHGLVWSTNENPTIENHEGANVIGTGIGEFTGGILNLTPNTGYYVRAYATNSAGTGYGNNVEFKTLAENGDNSPPQAAFTGSPTSGTAPLTVNFTDQSTNSPTSWQWNFGDGSTSTQRNPTNIYNSAGTYTVSLTATNSHGSHTETKTNYIQVSTAGNAPTANFSASPTSGAAPLGVSFTDQSTNSPTSWQWTFGDGNSSNQQNPSHTYNTPGNYTVSLTVSNAHGSDSETKNNYITVSDGGGNGDETEVVEVLNPATGKTWMDRNLGASRAATSSTDAEAYGHLYQWGRAADGHQIRTSGTTSTLSNSDTPGHGHFITVDSFLNDWRIPQNHNLWQGVNSINNPCPAGYRLPTEAELNAERLSWSSNNASGAFASPLKLPLAGYRDHSNGSLGDVGSYGGYWSSTADDTYSRHLYFYSSNGNMNSYYRADGFSVRCLKD